MNSKGDEVKELGWSHQAEAVALLSLVTSTFHNTLLLPRESVSGKGEDLAQVGLSQSALCRHTLCFPLRQGKAPGGCVTVPYVYGRATFWAQSEVYNCVILGPLAKAVYIFCQQTGAWASYIIKFPVSLVTCRKYICNIAKPCENIPKDLPSVLLSPLSCENQLFFFFFFKWVIALHLNQ